jgi:hypothetical protein
MEVCYDETTKSWSTRPLTVREVVPTLKERIVRLIRRIIEKIKSFLKLH